MKPMIILLMGAVGLFASCSTTYKMGQTPDDLYFSPGKEGIAENESDPELNQNQSYSTNYQDPYLRRKVANRSRWGRIEDFDYWNDSRYDFNYFNYDYFQRNPYFGWTGGWNPGWNLSFGYGYGNIYYPGAGGYWVWNPIYTIVHYPSLPSPPKGTISSGIFSAYGNKNYNNTNLGFKDPKTGKFIPSNSNSLGNLLKKVFTGSNQEGSSFDRAARYFPSNTNSNSSTPNSNAGGNSGGFKSTGSSASTPRGPR